MDLLALPARFPLTSLGAAKADVPSASPRFSPDKIRRFGRGDLAPEVGQV
jgi:hypothetical protein